MDEYIGIVKLFAGNFAPQNWAFCWGQLLPINVYSALFSIIGTYYGGNGTTNFALPDLRGRSAVGYGTGLGLSPIGLGEPGGMETITLQLNNLPSHNHAVTGSVTLSTTREHANSGTPAGSFLAVTTPANNYNVTGGGGPLAGLTNNLGTGLTGSGLPFQSRNPFLGLSYIICLNGIFPPHGAEVEEAKP